MDGLSAASGAFAVASLAIQLGSNIKRLCDFWESVQDGSNDIRIMVNDLQIISYIIQEIRDEGSRNLKPHSRALSATLAALEGCSESVEILQEAIMEVQPSLACRKRSTRTWAAIKVAWSGDKMRKYQDTLLRMKMTLMLARQASIEQAAAVRDETQQLELNAIAEGMRELISQRSQQTIMAVSSISATDCGVDAHVKSLREECQRVAATIPNPVARFGFENLMDTALLQVSKGLGASFSAETQALSHAGNFPKSPGSFPKSQRKTSVRTTRVFTTWSPLGRLHLASRVSQRPYPRREPETERQELCSSVQTIFSFHPSQWLLTFGFSVGIQMILSKSYQGFDCRLTTYRAVPDDAMIFKLCERGATGAVQCLFDAGKASPWDTNSKGLSPLFFAARAGCTEVCNLLLSQGADMNARSLSNEAVASYACLKAPGSADPRQCTDHINTLRIFFEQFDFLDDINCSGLLGLRRLLSAKCNHPSCSHGPSYPAAFVWVFPLVKDLVELRTPAMARGIAQLFRHAMMADDVHLLGTIIPVIGDLNSRKFVKWFSPAHEIALNMWRYGVRNSDRYLLSQGLNLHIVTEDDFTRSGEVMYLGGHHTPLSFVLRYSESFFQFRTLLKEADIDIERFVDDDLLILPWLGSGWTRGKLLGLFSMSFRVLRMPLMTCEMCCMEGVATEWSWLTVLEALRSGEIINMEENFAARDRNLLESCNAEGTICHYCFLKGREETLDDTEEPNSVFLIPL